mmetsp:Transcript_7689/g.18532  ORF Transcript_7689/g.18532 Transcript_7689/m.18532 type:complete len:85 (+) Transcript_7689:2153-2407(+)
MVSQASHWLRPRSLSSGILETFFLLLPFRHSVCFNKVLQHAFIVMWECGKQVLSSSFNEPAGEGSQSKMLNLAPSILKAKQSKT